MHLSKLIVEDRRPTIGDLCFGASGISGLFSVVPREEAIKTLHRALDLGFTKFDTAPLYGTGLSERYLGEALSAKGGVEIATKVGRVIKKKTECDLDDDKVVWSNEDVFLLDGTKTDDVPVYDYSPAGIEESFRQSSERLRNLPVKCLRLHDAETEEYYKWVTESGGLQALVQLRSLGHVKQISLGMNNPDFLLRYIRNSPPGTFDNILVAGCWNLVDVSGFELLRECQQRGIGVVLAGIFGSGLLWGSTRLRYVTADTEAVEKRDKWAALAEKYGCTLPGVAVAFAFLPKCVTQLCVGCDNSQQLELNVGLLDQVVPKQLWHEAKELKLLEEWVPIP